MPRVCNVPGCRSNYNFASSSKHINTFTFPKDNNRCVQWLDVINKATGGEFKLRQSSSICVNHFNEEFIIRNTVAQRDDGSILSVPLRKPKLTPNAYPTIFYNDSLLLTEDVDKKLMHNQSENYGKRVKRKPAVETRKKNTIIKEGRGPDSDSNLIRKPKQKFNDFSIQLEQSLQKLDAAKDDASDFGEFVAQEMRYIDSVEMRQKMKRAILNIIVNINDEDEIRQFANQ